MRELSHWSPRRVIWACVLWLVGAPLAAAVGLVLGAAVLAGLSGKNTIGLSARLTDLALAWFFLPPILLVAAWLWARSRAHHSAGSG